MLHTGTERMELKPERKQDENVKMTKDIDGIKTQEKNVLLRKRPGKVFLQGEVEQEQGTGSHVFQADLELTR